MDTNLGSKICTKKFSRQCIFFFKLSAPFIAKNFKDPNRYFRTDLTVHYGRQGVQASIVLTG